MRLKKTIILSAVFLLFLKSGCCFENALNDYFGNNAEYGDCTFADVPPEHWAAEEISFLAKYGIVSGNDGLFYPDTKITRAQFIKILILAFGLYDENAACNFIDVPKNSWHYPYAASAYNLGIAKGIGNNEFGADMLLQRQQMAVLLYEAANQCGISYDYDSESGLADMHFVDKYAENAVAALYYNKIIKGDENNRFSPKDAATRAQASKMIYNVIESFF